MSVTRTVTPRYLWARLTNAVEAVLADVSSGSSSSGAASLAGSQQLQGSMLQRFQEAYRQSLTKVIALTGQAMAPALNAAAAEDKSAYEKLVIRLIPRPSARTVGLGDVVAFNSPLDPANSHSVMVRRVAALEGQLMLTSDDEAFAERVPLGHCWVLADNEQLAPPDVIDSRSFGYLDMRLIMGRAIFHMASPHKCGPVANSPQSEASDAAVIASEVDVEALAAGMPGEQQQQDAQPQQEKQPQQSSSKQQGEEP